MAESSAPSLQLDEYHQLTSNLSCILDVPTDMWMNTTRRPPKGMVAGHGLACDTQEQHFKPTSTPESLREATFGRNASPTSVHLCHAGMNNSTRGRAQPWRCTSSQWRQKFERIYSTMEFAPIHSYCTDRPGQPHLESSDALSGE
jgi:hypothetical protein